MRSLKLFGLSLLLAAGASQAQVTATVTGVSDYDFRGVSLTQEDPALQASVDWADDSGLYVGAWGSNVDFGPGTESDFELDVYAGFTGEMEGGAGWDLGIVYYSYWPDDDDINYPELYAGITYQWVGLKAWYTNDYGNTSDGQFYLEANANVDIAQGFGAMAHVGQSSGTAIDNAFGDSYIDWAVGVTKSFGNFDFELKYVDTDLDIPDVGEGRLILSVSTTFPWGQEEG